MSDNKLKTLRRIRVLIEGLKFKLNIIIVLLVFLILIYLGGMV